MSGLPSRLTPSLPALLLLVAVAVPAAASAAPLINQRAVRLHLGDLPRWSDPTLDDTSWPRLQVVDVPSNPGLLVLRAHLRLAPGDLVPGRPIGLYLAALASCEVSWDGAILGHSGQPAATAAAEVPGPLESHWMVPPHLAGAGPHVVALRCSAHHRHFTARSGYWTLLVGDYDSLLTATRAGTTLSLMSASGMLMVGIFTLVTFLADRRDRSFLWLSLVCFAGAALLLAESWRTLFGYTYDRHLWRLVVVTALTALLNLAILTFVATRFPGRGRRPKLALFLLFGAGVLVSLAAPGWDGKAFGMFFAGLTLSTLWVLGGALRRERGSLAAACGLVVALAAMAWRPALFADLTLYFALDFLLLCLLAAHALQVRRERAAREAALVKSARLEADLLRKHIQPHFLMNTLTALSEWVEEEPPVAAEMIEALAEEFRILSSISDRRLITLADELRLCRSHAAVMSRRKGKAYRLDVDGVDPADLVPPAVFHTLVENAITHDSSRDGDVALRLAASGGARVRYTFEAPLGEDPEDPEDAGAWREGTGLRYIRSRLRESFGTDWSLWAGPEDGRWRTRIEMPRRR